MPAQFVATKPEGTMTGAGQLAVRAATSLSQRLPGYLVLAVLVIVLVIVAVALASPGRRRPLVKLAAWLTGGLAASYAVIRAAAEFVTVNYGDPASYRDDWGGPSLAGVFAVHAGPGLAVLVCAAVVLARRKRRARARPASRP